MVQTFNWFAVTSISLLHHVAMLSNLIRSISEAALTTLHHLLVDGGHDVVGSFEILSNAVLKSDFLRIAESIGTVGFSECFTSADFNHVGGHLNLGFHSNSLHFFVFSFLSFKLIKFNGVVQNKI